MKNYLTLEKEYEGITVIERSKFICRIKPIKDENAAKTYLADIIKKEVGATHNCYAYILEGETVFKFSDDGEPHGTAGQPMLEVLKNKNLKNVIAVVSRYFGGIKLGTGGLSRAYSGAVSDCLKNAELVYKTFATVFMAAFDYNVYSKLKKIFDKDGVKVFSTEYKNGVEVIFAVAADIKEDFISGLCSAANGKVILSEKYSEYIAFSG